MKKSNYKYQVGEIVNDTLKIVSQTKHPKYIAKAYEVASMVYPNAPTYIISEGSLVNGQGCAYKVGRRVFEDNSIYSIESLRPYIVDVKEAKTISKGSSKYKIKVKCTECQKEKLMKPNSLSTRGFFCDLCDKGTSYPELFMMAYLEVKGIKYEYQKVFKDLPNRRFDFYLPKSNTIIETHGIQHYKKSGNWDFKETKNSDQIKKDYCNKNNIQYLSLNTSNSNFDFMLHTINNSKLPTINVGEYNLILEKISLNKKYPVKDIISMYKGGKSTTDIGEKLNINQRTIFNILKKHNINTSKKQGVRCRTTGEEFESIAEAQNKYHAPSISRACKNRKSFSGRHPETNMKLKWEYIED